MCDVLFVIPSVEPSINYESLGTLLLASILRQKGIKADIYRFYEAQYSKGFDTFVSNCVAGIADKKPSIVSFYCRCDCYLADLIIARKLKEVMPEVVIIFGGPQADASCADTLREFPFVDYCCSGEGETTIFPLCYGVLHGADVTEVDGLTYRADGGEIVSNPRAQLGRNLDDVPDIDFGLLPCEIIENSKKNDDRIPIDVGRGCPFDCKFCSTCLFWERKFRIKSPQKIIGEMMRLYKEYGFTNFKFNHDLFTASKKRVLAFCDEIRKSGVKFRWSCSSRIDTLDEETIDAMVESGLELVYLGVESGSERMQKIIHKNLKTDDVFRVVRKLCDKGITVIPSFIFGFPEETVEDLELTLQLIHTVQKMGATQYQLHLFAMFPGTEYYDEFRDELEFAPMQSNAVGNFGVEENYDFICKHKNLFPFYYEYRNEFRTQFASLENTVRLCMQAYDMMQLLDPDKHKELRIVDIYLGLKNASEVRDRDRDIFTVDKYRLIYGYMSTLYSGDELEKVREILRFEEDNLRVRRTAGDVVDVKSYSVDINSYRKGATLSQLELLPNMVYFNKVGGRYTCVAKPFIKL